MVRTEQALMTLEEYAAFEEPDERYVSELVRGVVVREPRPGSVHGRVQVRIGAELDTWARRHGARVTAESGYILGDEPATLRGPDVAVVLRPRPSAGEPGGWVRGAPDVAVEVLSPSDTSMAVQQKTQEYLAAGSRLVWVVDPSLRSATVYRPDGSARVLRDEDTLEGEDVLEGFAVRLADLFE
jgi:Uma2 family endonuclease